MLKYTTVYFVTYSRLPNNIPASELFEKVAIGAEINILTGQILNVSATLPSELARNMVESYLKNKNIIIDFDQIIEEIAFRHQGEAQKAIIKSVIEIKKKYLNFIETHNIKVDFIK